MNSKYITTVIVLVAVLLLAQTVSVVEAHHKSKDTGEARTAADKNDDLYGKNSDNLKTEVDEVKKTFKAYKTAFDAWKVAKEDYKDAKSTQVQNTIDTKKIILDAAIITKDDAYKKYQFAKSKL